MSDGTPVSVRLPGDLMAALRVRAEEGGMTISEALRIGALLLLGICPTCGQKAPVPAGNEPDPGKDPS